jgi:hypothetical protein
MSFVEISTAMVTGTFVTLKETGLGFVQGNPSSCSPSAFRQIGSLIIFFFQVQVRVLWPLRNHINKEGNEMKRIVLILCAFIALGYSDEYDISKCANQKLWRPRRFWAPNFDQCAKINSL